MKNKTNFLKKFFSFFTKKSEIKLLQKQIANSTGQLEKLNTLSNIGFIAASTAHEINNPLAAIKLCTEELIDAAKKDRHEFSDLKNQIIIITQAIERVELLTKKMLTLSLASEKSDNENFDLNTSINNLINLYQAEFNLRGITIHTNLPENSTFLGPKIQIEQAIINLINNACYALSDNVDFNLTNEPTIKITLENISDKLSIKIWNNGPIIPTKEQETLFVPFVSNKPVTSGNGLGLAISKTTIQNHNGELNLSYSNDQGTEFALSFNKGSALNDNSIAA